MARRLILTDKETESDVGRSPVESGFERQI